MGNGSGYVLAIYDVRGIQNYIFKTSKLKHAIGASAIVETIIEDALKYAVSKLDGNITSELEWEGKEYTGDNKDVQVLYIGGGNAIVLINGEALYLEITKTMSRYVLDKTYSLQLAATYVKQTNNYQDDYKNLNQKMTKVKANMPDSKPVGALPIMQVELSTGLPITKDDFSLETKLKLEAELHERKKIASEDKRFDNLIEEKGEDSMMAVVHIDGNNMGLRIRQLVENAKSYTEAVNLMRTISFNINHSYKNAFEEMKNEINASGVHTILPVLTAGDDITYVCNAKAAIASMECFVNKIKEKTMTGMHQDVDKYGFSVCGGIAFMRSHFPFSIGYQVAEACCESAKDRAKSEISESGVVGNFFDFQFCQNVQTMDIDVIRANEYITPTNEKLLTRPFEISENCNKYYSYNYLKKYLRVFSNFKESEQKGTCAKELPRSFAKQLRNLYPIGKYQVEGFISFLGSRKWKLPDGDLEAYVEADNTVIAKYYDALELMDVYEDLSNIVTE